MKLPSIEECEALISEFGMPQHIRAHTGEVRIIANFIAQKIIARGVKIDLALVDRAALMHDFLKMHCIANGCSHSHEAERVLAERGFKEFGLVVREHGLEEVLSFGSGTTLEAKIVWYADKRVNHDKIVSLGERFDYLKEHYGRMSEGKMSEIVSTEKPSFALEAELMELAGLTPDLPGLEVSSRA